MARLQKFGSFRLDVKTRVLFRGADPVAVGERAASLLALLLENPGAVVSKDELMAKAWPRLTVEESNLTVQIAALRRALGSASEGANWIETVPRRGYRYAGPPVAADDDPGRDAIRPLDGGRPSIAVLPFDDLSPGADQRHLADGMVEDIVAGLSRIKWLFVVARGSSDIYKGPTIDTKRAAGELGVRYVVRGSIRSESGRVRIAAQIVDAQTAQVLWSDRFDRPLGDLFALQDEIALNVVGALEPTLRREEARRVARKRPDSLDAYGLVLRAQPDMDSGMPDQVARALPLVEWALRLEPDYALAHAYAAMCHHCLFLRAGLGEAHRCASMHHARDAIKHGQDDALALAFGGFSIGMDGHDRTAAVAALEAALALSPSSALAYAFGSVIFGWGGEAERAIVWGTNALRLSPFDAWAFASLHGVLLGHFRRREFADAAKAAQKAVLCNPVHSISHVLLAACLAKTGGREEAHVAARHVLDLQPAFRLRDQFCGVNCDPELAAALGDALEGLDLPP